MTEQTPDIDPAAQAAPSVQSSPVSVASRSRRTWAWVVIILILVCLALGSALWYQRKQFVTAGQEIAGRINVLGSELGQAQRDARRALMLAQAQSDKVAALENSVQEVRSQYSALEQAWQNFSESAGDGVLINDIDRLLTIANQQLRLAGSVSNAIVALEAAQSRLASANRPRLSSLQQAINGDLDRLRAVPTIDIPTLSGRIERLVTLVSKAPLLVPDQAAPDVRPTTAEHASRPRAVDDTLAELPPNAPWWQRWRAQIASWPARAGSILVYELGDLIEVQRVDQPAALLLSSEQAGQLRSTLKQRLLTAQLALLMRQPEVWKSELTAVNDVLNRYFDRRAADAQAAQALAQSLQKTELQTSLPNVTDSLSAVAAMRAAASTPNRQE